jgi:putative oxidoreductase
LTALSLRGLIKALLATNEAIGAAAAPIALLGRVLMIAFFLHEGFDQVADFAGTQTYMQGFGVWPGLAPLVILAEIVGGLLVLVGLATRPAAIGLAVFTALTALFFHNDFSKINQLIHFQKNVSIVGGFLILAAFGPGAWSLDGWLANRAR